MSDKANARPKRSTSKSGVLPRPILEPEGRREPIAAPLLPELRDEERSHNVGILPDLREGIDNSAEREDDPATAY